MSADEYSNDGTVEMAWAIKAFEEAELHFNIITSVDPSFLKLSPDDDFIYEEFRKSFPNFEIENIAEESLKSEVAKKEWRQFCNKFQGKIDNFNYGTLLRLNPYEDYSEANSIFATRIQFLAIEVARNREGLNKKTFQDALNERISKKKDNKLDEVINATQDVSIVS